MATPQELAAHLQQVPLFADLSVDECADIISASTCRVLKAATQLCAEGQPGDSMFIIQSGRVRVHKKTAQGADEELAVLGPRSVVGEMALLDGQTRSATVTMVEDGTVLVLGQSGFLRLRQNLRPAALKIMRNLARILCRHLRDLNARIEDFYAHPDESLKAMWLKHQALVAAARERTGTGAPPASSPVDPARDGRGVAPVYPYSPAGSTGTEAEKLAFLEHVPMFHGWPLADLKMMLGMLTEQSMMDGEALCREGEEGDAFFILARGRVAVEKSVSQGAPHTVVTLNPGALVGDISLIDGGPRSTTCVARGPVVVFRGGKTDMDQMFTTRNSFALRFVERLALDLSRRVREADARFTEIFSRPGETIEQLRRRVVELRSHLPPQ